MRLETPWLSAAELEGLRDALAAWSRPSTATLPADGDPFALPLLGGGWNGLRRAADTGDLAPYLEAVRQQVRELRRQRGPGQPPAGGTAGPPARSPTGFAQLVDQLTRSLPTLLQILVDFLASDRPRLVRALGALQRLLGLILATAGGECLEPPHADVPGGPAEGTPRRETPPGDSGKASAPAKASPAQTAWTLTVWPGVVLVPAAGWILQSQRAGEALAELIQAVAAMRPRVVIVDLAPRSPATRPDARVAIRPAADAPARSAAGTAEVPAEPPVPEERPVDTLWQAARTLRLLGAIPILVGLDGGLARALAVSGHDLDAVEARPDLPAALETALALLGRRIACMPGA